jgi:hypothetical protein
VFVREAIKSCISVGLFSEEIFNESKVLTSKTVQETFLRVSGLTKRLSRIEQYSLINSDFTDDKSEETQVNSEETQVNSEKLPLKKSKVKEKESKENNLELSDDNSLSKGELSTRKNSKDENINYEALLDYFIQETKGVFGKPKGVSDKRRAAIRARVREYGKEAFVEMIHNAAASDYLKGQNHRCWTASFDWMIKPENFVKILSGNYDNHNNNNNRLTNNIYHGKFNSSARFEDEDDTSNWGDL